MSSSIGGNSYSTGSSPSLSRELHTNYDDEDGEEPNALTVDRENSFEDLEQFLTQLDWAPPHGSTDDTCSDLELTFDSSMQLEQDEGHQELEMRALREHLKAIVKDIHIAIGEHDGRGWNVFVLHRRHLTMLILNSNNFLLLLKMLAEFLLIQSV